MKALKDYEKMMSVIAKIRDRVSEIEQHDLDIEDVVLEIDQMIEQLEEEKREELERLSNYELTRDDEMAMMDWVCG